MWWTLTAAVWAATPSWERLVTYDLDPSSVRATPSEAAAMARAACARGSRPACEVAEGAEVIDVVEARCAAGDDFACHATGWGLESTAPDEAFAHYERLCGQGLTGACTDIARAYRDGRGVWQSVRKARQLAEPLCADGDARACLIIASLDQQARPLRAEAIAREAVDAGRPEGLALLADVVRPELRASLQSQACAAGDGASCRRVARLRRASEDATAEVPSDAEEAAAEVDPLAPVDVDAMSADELLFRACDLRDDEGCVVAVLLSVERGELARSPAIERLAQLCDAVPQACIERDYLAYGGDVRAFKEGTLAPLQADYVLNVIVPHVFDCYREALDRDPGFREDDLQVYTWLDTEGRTRGGAVMTDGDEAYRECLVATVSDRQFYELPEPLQVMVPLHLDHEPVMLVDGKRYYADPQQLLDLEAHVREHWASDAEQCFLENGGSAFDKVFTLRDMRVRRDGQVEWGDVVESTGIDDVEACLDEVFADIHLGRPYMHHVKGRMYVKFAVIFRHPRILFQHGEAMDPDLYMNREGGSGSDDTLSDSRDNNDTSGNF